MKKERICIYTTLLLTATLCMLGCKEQKVLGTVSGNVTFQGQPVTEGMVLFSAQDQGIHMTAKLDDKGHYEVKQAVGAGLQPGDYQVSVAPPILDMPIDMDLTKPVKVPTYPNIPRKYRDPKTSRLTLTVTEAGTTFDIDMKP